MQRNETNCDGEVEEERFKPAYIFAMKDKTCDPPTVKESELAKMPCVKFWEAEVRARENTNPVQSIQKPKWKKILCV